MHYSHKNKLPYRVRYCRTNDWFSDRWGKLAEWCDDYIGNSPDDWDYIDEEFYFSSDDARLLFLLAWGERREV